MTTINLKFNLGDLIDGKKITDIRYHEYLNDKNELYHRIYYNTYRAHKESKFYNRPIRPVTVNFGYEIGETTNKGKIVSRHYWQYLDSENKSKYDIHYKMDCGTIYRELELTKIDKQPNQPTMKPQKITAENNELVKGLEQGPSTALHPYQNTELLLTLIEEHNKLVDHVIKPVTISWEGVTVAVMIDHNLFGNNDVEVARAYLEEQGIDVDAFVQKGLEEIKQFKAKNNQ